MIYANFEILGTYCTFYNKVEILSNTYNVHFQLFTLATNVISNTYNVLVCVDILSLTYYKCNLLYLIALYIYTFSVYLYNKHLLNPYESTVYECMFIHFICLLFRLVLNKQ